MNDYTQQLIALQPPGKALPTDPASNWVMLLDALAQEFGRVDGRLTDLTNEITVSDAATEMLSDWERVLGLPDPCAPAPTDPVIRRARIRAKLSSVGGQSRAYFIGVLAQLGVTATITNLRPFEMGLSGMGDGLGDVGWASTMLFTVTTPIDLDTQALIKCVINQIAPAHGIVQWQFANTVCIYPLNMQTAELVPFGAVPWPTADACEHQLSAVQNGSTLFVAAPAGATTGAQPAFPPAGITAVEYQVTLTPDAGAYLEVIGGAVVLSGGSSVPAGLFTFYSGTAGGFVQVSTGSASPPQINTTSLTARIGLYWNAIAGQVGAIVNGQNLGYIGAYLPMGGTPFLVAESVPVSGSPSTGSVSVAVEVHGGALTFTYPQGTKGLDGAAAPVPAHAQALSAVTDAAGTSTTVTFDRPISLSSVAGFALSAKYPANIGGGTVYGPVNSISITGQSVAGDTVTFTHGAIRQNYAVALAYDGTGTLTDTAGQVPSFTLTSQNQSANQAGAPSLVAAIVQNAVPTTLGGAAGILNLYYDIPVTALDTGNPAAAAFVLSDANYTADGWLYLPAGITIACANAHQQITPGEVLTLDYTAATCRIVNSADHTQLMANISNFPITNQATALVYPVGAAVQADGLSTVVTFNYPLTAVSAAGWSLTQQWVFGPAHSGSYIYKPNPPAAVAITGATLSPDDTQITFAHAGSYIPKFAVTNLSYNTATGATTSAAGAVSQINQTIPNNSSDTLGAPALIHYIAENYGPGDGSTTPYLWLYFDRHVTLDASTLGNALTIHSSKGHTYTIPAAAGDTGTMVTLSTAGNGFGYFAGFPLTVNTSDGQVDTTDGITLDYVSATSPITYTDSTSTTYTLPGFAGLAEF